MYLRFRLLSYKTRGKYQVLLVSEVIKDIYGEFSAISNNTIFNDSTHSLSPIDFFFRLQPLHRRASVLWNQWVDPCNWRETHWWSWRFFSILCKNLSPPSKPLFIALASDSRYSVYEKTFNQLVHLSWTKNRLTLFYH